MKMTKHIEYLLRQGWKPRELEELGFPKSVVTRVRRRLRREEGIQRPKVHNSDHRVKANRSGLATSSDELAVMQQKLASLQGDLRRMDSTIQELKTRLDNSPSAGLKAGFKCTQCGTQGLVAIYVKCTKCGMANWWGWWPEK